MTDHELVDRARRGDAHAWAALVERHHRAVFRSAFAALLREDEADEAAQEAWIAAWQHLDGFRADASLRTWLVAIAWRKALDRRRSMSHWRKRLGMAPRDADGEAALDLLPDRGQLDAERHALDREARRRVRRALTGVPRAQRDCLLLAAGGELTYEEIGMVLEIPVGTVKWRVSEGRKRLRTRIEGLRDE